MSRATNMGARRGLGGRVSSAAAAMQSLEARLLMVTSGELDVVGIPTKGFTVSNFIDGQNDALDVLKLKSGAVIVGGAVRGIGARSDAIVGGYLGKGKLMTDFGVNGVTTLSFGKNLDDVISGVTAGPGGKILAVGTTSNGTDVSDMFVVRLNANGSFDTTFNKTGYRRIDVGGGNIDRGSKILYDAEIDKVVVVGSTAAAQFGATSVGGVIMLRLNSNGSNDTSFGKKGVFRTTSPLGKLDVGLNLYRQGDGKYLFSGGRLSFNQSAFTGSAALVGRVTKDGKADGDFGSAGIKSNPFGRAFEFYTTVSQGPGNKVYAAGTSSNGAGEFGAAIPKVALNFPSASVATWCFARYKSDGGLDNTFSGDGLTVVNFGAGQVAGLGDATVQEDGAIVAGGGTGVSGQNAQIATARLDKDGNPDKKWGKLKTGIQLIALAGLSSGFFAMRVLRQGVILGVGHAKTTAIRGGVLVAALVNLALVKAFTPFASSSASPAMVGAKPLFGTEPIIADGEDQEGVLG